MNKILELLITDLSLRSNNPHAGSGLGGNPSEFLFMLTHNIEMNHQTDDTVSITEEDGKIVISCPKDAKIPLLRKELSKFYNERLNKQMANFDRLTASELFDLDKQVVSFQQLADIDFLSKIERCPNIDFLINGLNLTRQLLSSISANEMPYGSFSKETNSLAGEIVASSFPMYIVCFCIREVIGIDAMVKYNLDEHPILDELLSKINSSLEDGYHD